MQIPERTKKLLGFRDIKEMPNREIRAGEVVGIRCRIASLRSDYVRFTALSKRSTCTAFEPGEITWVRDGLGLHIPGEELIIGEQKPTENELFGFFEAVVADPKPDPDEPRVVRIKVVNERADTTEYFNVKRSDLFVSEKG